ncbi:MAG: hypothetical protein H7330_07995 [Hymenobacteraceae bacterium]|nr:hypothetical protein [Hymenobacteraceae bacterium]
MPVTPPTTLPSSHLLFSRESAPAMRERLRVLALNFSTHQSAFAGLNPLFAGPGFGAGLTQAVKNAEQVRDFDSRVAAGQQATNTEAEALAACRPRCQGLFYAVRQAWPATGPGGKATQGARLKEFGQDKYAAAREVPAQMAALIEQAALAYTTPGYAAALAAVGWLADPQQKALTAAAQTLRNAAAQQGRQSGVNAEDAGTYYLAQNQLYWFGQQLSEAAELVFADEPAVRTQFRLSPEGPEEFQMTLKPGQRKAVHLSAVLSPTRVLRFRVRAVAPDPLNADARLWVDFLPAEDAPVEHRRFLEATPKGKTQQLTAAELGEAGPWLAIENLTAEEAVVTVVVGE